MTLMLNPTQEVNVDPTESLHAWSQEDDITEVVDYRQRSWRIPALLAVLAAAIAVGAGMFLAWPHQSATKPQVASIQSRVAKPMIPASPPVQVISPDQRFLALVQQRGVRIVSSPLALKAAHAICIDEKNGYTDVEIAEQLVKTTPGTNLQTEAIFVDTAREVYCP
jgi:hypothetical protein